MIKVHYTDDCFLDREMLKQEFEIVQNWNEADIIISGSFPNHYIPQVILPNFPLHKLIYMTSEPSICMPRTYFYDNFDKMFLVVRYNPTKPNEIPLTIDNSHGAEYPYAIVPFTTEPITRKDTAMTFKGIFMAGELSLDSDAKPHGFINIRRLRRQFAELLDQNKCNLIVGKGTRRGMIKPTGEVRKDKQDLIASSNCDFVIAMENSVYPDYVTEKIGEGFTSDRVTLYLGAPNIEKHVPLNCFVDLRKWFNSETKEFDFKGMLDYLYTMKQEEYDEILKNAREFRKNSREKYMANQKNTTQKVIDYIKEHSSKTP